MQYGYISSQKVAQELVKKVQGEITRLHGTDKGKKLETWLGSVAERKLTSIHPLHVGCQIDCALRELTGIVKKERKPGLFSGGDTKSWKNLEPIIKEVYWKSTASGIDVLDNMIQEATKATTKTSSTSNSANDYHYNNNYNY